MIRRLGAPILAVVTGALVLLLGIGGAAASHNTFEQVSIGATGSNGSALVQFVGASPDGTRAFLRTAQRLTVSDTDSQFDLFENAGGAISHISIGPNGGNGGDQAVPQFGGSSVDGGKVFFESYDELVAADDDDCEPADPLVNGCSDVYQWSGGTTTLMSVGTPGGADENVEFEDASDDGNTVFMRTFEPLVASDTDAQLDVYERSGGTTKLVSTGPAGGNGSFPALFRGASTDGTRVFFTTDEQLVAGDTDSTADIYQRAGGTTTLLSTGPAGGNGAVDAAYRGTTAGGTQVFIETEEQLTAGDTDGRIDVYERSGSTTTLVSTGPTGGNGTHEARFKKASAGGTRLFFQTAERMTAGDTDSAIDVYERSGGATALVSTGTTGGNGAFDATLQDVSSDGGTVLIGTAEALTGSDTDARFDVYSRAAGNTTLVTTGPSGGNGNFDAYFDGMSRDGKRVFFESLEPLASDDTDAFPDVFERSSGATTKISDGPNGGNGSFISVFRAASDDGTRAFFSTIESIVPADTDSNVDVYAARIAAGHVRPKGATPTRVALVLAYRACTSPNRAHGPPALGGGSFDGSCNPPQALSDHLTVGTADSNGRASNAIGSLTYTTLVGDAGTQADEADVRLQFELTDVRRKSDLLDYTGQLEADATVRLTDRYNGSSPIDPGTMSEVSFPFVIPCAATGDTGVGSTCSVDTTADAVVPGVVSEGARAIWQLGQVEVRDGGADGQVATGPNTVFAKQGIFIP